ncbi:GNAT family N-acetyltransferase [Magnetofaba australis]|uniref:Putative acetyl-CoA hydrolase/transferase n=1 Tax=Magnetofaba australis IT-1 TaxID=1434232 RepID=A0A1Y2K7J9_9PROT|nr:putative acetyl-CoA hydrolase/transferase [Magnetofaba australis IT-1]
MDKKAWKQYVKSGDRIFFGSNAAVPLELIKRFLPYVDQFHDLQATHLLTLGETPWVEPQYEPHLKVNALFLGRGPREAVCSGHADYTPCFLSEIPSLFYDGVLPIDVAFVMVSPPDPYGYCSLGVGVDIAVAAVRTADFVIAQINPNMPRTFGQSFIHVNEIDAAMEIEAPVPQLMPAVMDDVTQRIGRYVSLLINDGACLQMGIGKIPDAVLANLTKHNDLGIHTEMFSDGVIDLFMNGNINNSRKSVHRGKIVTSFAMGSQKLYDFVHENPHVEFHPSEYVNNPAVIRKNDHHVSINSAIEVDLTGQVVSDSVGTRFYSGIGGQVDFIRGASLSRGGRPIIALPSTAMNGAVSKIVPFITEGSGVVTSRGDVHYVVTEYGIATLRGKSVRERALELIQVAHPDFRDWLLERVREHFYVPHYQDEQPSKIKDMGDLDMVRLNVKGNKDYFLRPLRPADERLIQEFFYSHTPETLQQRYRYTPEQLSREKAHALVSVDQSRDPALCVVTRSGPNEIIQAVGRYYYLEEDQSGEVAFVTHETKRGQGLGGILLEHLKEIAQKRGLKKLVAYVRSDNAPMLHVLEKSGFKAKRTEDPMEVTLTCKFKDSGASE